MTSATATTAVSVTSLSDEMHAVKQVLSASQEQLAVRQIYHALNEKLLRKMNSSLKEPIDVFWKRRVTNIGGFSRSRDTMEVWKELQVQYGFEEDPRDFWENVKDGKKEFDLYIHDASYPKYNYAQLKVIADRVFVGDRKKFKEAFLYYLDVNVKLSREIGVGLYDY